jgi:hypothetical protein
MMLVRLTQGIVWDGADHVAGDILDVDPRRARIMVEGYKHAEYVREAPPAQRGMMVTADPVVESRDPVEKPKRRRA